MKRRKLHPQLVAPFEGGATPARPTARQSKPTPWPLSKNGTLACAALLLAAMAWAYWPTLAGVWRAWIDQPDYSHGFLVAPIAIGFLWARRGTCPVGFLRPSLWGLMALVVVGLLRVAAGRYYLQPLDAWTIPLWVAASVWMMFGAAALRWALPSIVFLWFMFPIPYSAETALSVPLQAVAARLSTNTLVLLGQSALREGNTIWLDEHQLNVAEACSGLRIFVGIFALAFAFVLFSRWSWWQKAMALVAVLPIAVIANVTRIVATGLLMQTASGETAQKFFHDFSGVVMIPFAALLFWGLLAYLERLFPEVELVSPTARMAVEARR